MFQQSLAHTGYKLASSCFLSGLLSYLASAKTVGDLLLNAETVVPDNGFLPRLILLPAGSAMTWKPFYTDSRFCPNALNGKTDNRWMPEHCNTANIAVGSGELLYQNVFSKK